MRMIDFPIGLPVNGMTPQGGPTVLGATESETSFVQGVVNPFGLWQFQLNIAPMRGAMAREFKRLSVAALGGANCFRVPFCDFDPPTWSELGLYIDGTSRYQPWEHGLNWDNGQPWSIGKPLVPVAAASAKDSGTITLDLTYWNGVVPAFFGIVGHFALYAVTGATFAGDIATLRVWPPVRRAVTTADYATLNPVLACRLAGPQGAPWTRDAFNVPNARLDLIEVPDEVVLGYVSEDAP